MIFVATLVSVEIPTMDFVFVFVLHTVVYVMYKKYKKIQVKIIFDVEILERKDERDKALCVIGRLKNNNNNNMM